MARALISARMQARPGHFMPPALLDSQLRDLEPLQADEHGFQVDIRLAPEELISQIAQQCGAAAQANPKNQKETK
jgi:gluconokinase